jgi:hypothetical protein
MLGLGSGSGQSVLAGSGFTDLNRVGNYSAGFLPGLTKNWKKVIPQIPFITSDKRDKSGESPLFPILSSIACLV